MKLLEILAIISLSLLEPYSINAALVRPGSSDINYRLDDSVIPSFYEIHITPYFLENEAEGKDRFSFDGETKITLRTSVEDKKDIVLHSTYHEISKIEIVNANDVEAPTIEVVSHELDRVTDKLTIKLDTALKVNEDYVLTITYMGRVLENELFGFYLSRYYTDSGKRYFGVTQFEATSARKAFPCFDEPKFKAEFVLHINHHNTYRAWSNSKIDHSIQLPDINRTIDVFKPTPIMSTYTLAFMVSDFEQIISRNNFSVIGEKSTMLGSIYTLAYETGLLEILDEYTGIPYYSIDKVDKLDIIAVADFEAGAMENWGLIIAKDNVIFASKYWNLDKEYAATVIAHEMAHMWFGNLVTCDWWSSTWLNEGLTTFLQHHAMSKFNPDWDDGMITDLQQALAYDTWRSYPLTDKSVASPNSIKKMFGAITYKKGSAIMRMFEHVLGPENFKQALRHYLNENKFKTGTPEILVTSMNQFYEDKKVDLGELLVDWTEQVGYPLITVTLSDDKTSFTLSQEKFGLRMDDQWIVPISYTTNKEKDFDCTKPDLFLKKDTEETVNLDHPVDWVLVNIQQSGFYRVNYDDNTWIEIGKALRAYNHSGIHEFNRAQIIDDLFVLVKKSHVDYDTVFQVIQFLEFEKSALVWKIALDELTGMEYYSDLVVKQNYPILFEKIISNVYQKSKSYHYNLY